MKHKNGLTDTKWGRTGHIASSKKVQSRAGGEYHPLGALGIERCEAHSLKDGSIIEYTVLFKATIKMNFVCGDGWGSKYYPTTNMTRRVQERERERYPPPTQVFRGGS
eukprot:GEMP01054947.1.p1 GENE.GEMP01054947.1~~GEMP01054947.1.p1  ORF type:complete len:108 (+),score=1.88 GEMP01054947.1:1178-1501(+)